MTMLRLMLMLTHTRMLMFMSMPMPNKIVSPRADNRPGGMREAIRIRNTFGVSSCGIVKCAILVASSDTLLICRHPFDVSWTLLGTPLGP